MTGEKRILNEKRSQLAEEEEYWPVGRWAGEEWRPSPLRDPVCMIPLIFGICDTPGRLVLQTRKPNHEHDYCSPARPIPLRLRSRPSRSHSRWCSCWSRRFSGGGGKSHQVVCHDRVHVRGFDRFRRGSGHVALLIFHGPVRSNGFVTQVKTAPRERCRFCVKEERLGGGRSIGRRARI